MGIDETERHSRRAFITPARGALVALAAQIPDGRPIAGARGLEEDIVSVREFGAVGDGAADDTRAIQSAINATPPGGGIILFPVGTYRVTAA
jgi:polygalacturonase